MKFSTTNEGPYTKIVDMSTANNLNLLIHNSIYQHTTNEELEKLKTYHISDLAGVTSERPHYPSGVSVNYQDNKVVT